MSKNLGEFISLQYGRALSSDSRAGYGYPVYGSNGIVGNHDSALINGPGVIVGRKGSVGKVAWSSTSFWPIDTTYYIKTKNCNISWAYRVLDWLPLQSLDTSTGIPGLNRNDVYELSVFFPEEKEQSLIADILDTLDTQIEKTEALIAKLEKVKEGLLHDLLTRGIDENGQLRPSPEQAPELYKESPLGLIPKDWHTASLGSILDRIEAGKSPSCPDIPAPSGEWGVLKVSAVNPKGFRSSENKVVERRSLIVEHYEVKRGDLLITRANTPDLVGASCIVNDWTSRLMLSDKTLRLLEKPDLAIKEYIYHSLQQSYMRQQISIAATGTSMSMKNISQGAILTLSILVPPIDEQSDICKRVDVLAKRITHEKSKASKLYQDKSGLMNDLLTGRVRVTPLLEKNQATTPA